MEEDWITDTKWHNIFRLLALNSVIIAVVLRSKHLILEEKTLGLKRTQLRLFCDPELLAIG